MEFKAECSSAQNNISTKQALQIKVSMKQNWQDLAKFIITNENNDLKKSDENFWIKKFVSIFLNEDNFYEDCIDTLIQNILNVKHVIDDNNKLLTIVPIEGF